MKQHPRWMTSVLKEAAKAKIVMPWSRGAPRAATLAKRTEASAGARNARA